MARSMESAALSAFAQAFGTPPTLVAWAPSRVELLGNHTDYNGGLVLAVAIDRFTVVAGRPAKGREARVGSVNFGQSEAFGVDEISRGEAGTWGRYVRGVVWAMQQHRGALSAGFDATIAGDVPLGAGLSSSASLQAAVALFLLGLGRGERGAALEAFNDAHVRRGGEGEAGESPRQSDRPSLMHSSPRNPASHRGETSGLGQGGQSPFLVLDDPARMELAHVLRRSENEFVGVASGLLDQFSVLFGRTGHVLTLDCRSLEYDRVALGPSPPGVVVCDSKTSRRLADGMYNRRREECERVVAFFQAERGRDAVRTLRDVSLADLTEAWDRLDPVGRLRARHVLNENERVVRGSERLRAGDLAGFGRLISASHASSRDDFANSSPALDALVEAAEAAPGFLGGKLSGAGWAGCTVNLVAPGQAEAFAESVAASYARTTGTVPEIHICQAADGADCRPA
jgi:galactokinase